jgi:hypothetical protein
VPGEKAAGYLFRFESGPVSNVLTTEEKKPILPPISIKNNTLTSHNLPFLFLLYFCFYRIVHFDFFCFMGCGLGLSTALLIVSLTIECGLLPKLA